LCRIFVDCLIFEISKSPINPGVILEKDEVCCHNLDNIV
jgi:hypothetical protein